MPPRRRARRAATMKRRVEQLACEKERMDYERQFALQEVQHLQEELYAQTSVHHSEAGALQSENIGPATGGVHHVNTTEAFRPPMCGSGLIGGGGSPSSITI